MNLSFLLDLVKGHNIWETIAKILNFAGVYLANQDTDNKGTDDAIATVLLTASDGLSAYSNKNYTKAGNVIDAVIAALTKLKAELIRIGQVAPVNH